MGDTAISGCLAFSFATGAALLLVRSLRATLMNEAPFVSVVVPTRDRGSLLHHCLIALCGQDFSRDHYEIVVVDDGSKDNTPEIAAHFAGTGPPRVRCVRVDRKGLNTARNV